MKRPISVAVGWAKSAPVRRTIRFASLELLVLMWFHVSSCSNPTVRPRIGIPIPPDAEFIDQVPDPPPAWASTRPNADGEFRYFVGYFQGGSNLASALMLAAKNARSTVAADLVAVVEHSGGTVTNTRSTVVIRRAEERGTYWVQYMARKASVSQFDAVVLVRYPKREFVLAAAVPSLLGKDQKLTNHELLRLLHSMITVEIVGSTQDALRLFGVLRIVEPQVSRLLQDKTTTGANPQILIASESELYDYYEFMAALVEDRVLANQAMTGRHFTIDVLDTRPLVELSSLAHNVASREDRVRFFLEAQEAVPDGALADYIRRRVDASIQDLLSNDEFGSVCRIATTLLRANRVEDGLEVMRSSLDSLKSGKSQEHDREFAKYCSVIDSIAWAEPDAIPTLFVNKLLDKLLMQPDCGDEGRIFGLTQWLRTVEPAAYDDWLERAGWTRLAQMESSIEDCDQQSAINSYRTQFPVESANAAAQTRCLPLVPQLRLAYLANEYDRQAELFGWILDSGRDYPAQVGSAYYLAYLAQQSEEKAQERSERPNPPAHPSLSLIVQTASTAPDGLGDWVLAWYLADQGHRERALEAVGRAAEIWPTVNHAAVNAVDRALILASGVRAARSLDLWGLEGRLLRQYTAQCIQVPSLDPVRAAEWQRAAASPSRPRLNYASDPLDQVQSDRWTPEIEIYHPAGVQSIGVQNLTLGFARQLTANGSFDLRRKLDIPLGHGVNLMELRVNEELVDIVAVETETGQ